MSKKEIVSFFVLFILTIYFGGTLVSYIYFEDFSYGVTEYLLIIALVVSWGQFFTWGTRQEVKKDEMGKQIIQKSSSISYHILFYTLLLLWVIDFFFIGNGNNYTLFIALCIAHLCNPIIQFFNLKRSM
ncbi:hypothetical protein ACQKMI_19380 [Lysinibacillus sp. NPDC097214]|uniref:hypothetical protein n=1 Tax=Lysinibacillus sp. NPDC097214 TaxID=3390584 RepID=UPI003D075925